MKNEITVKVQNSLTKLEVKSALLVNKYWEQTKKNIVEILQTRWGKYALAIPLAINGMSIRAYADGVDAQGILDSIMKNLKPGVIALGSLVAVVGGIQLGKGFTRDDADAKASGMMTMIGGVIIAGVGAIIPESISFGSSGGGGN